MSTEQNYHLGNDRNKKNLAEDPDLIAFVNNPTEKSQAFWNHQIESGNVKESDFTKAQFIINSLQVKPELITQKELFILWENIEILNKKRLKRRRLFWLCSTVASTAIMTITVSILTHQRIIDRKTTAVTTLNLENIKPPKTKTSDIQLIVDNKDTVSFKGKTAKTDYQATNTVTVGQKEQSELKRPDQLVSLTLPSEKKHDDLKLQRPEQATAKQHIVITIKIFTLHHRQPY